MLTTSIFVSSKIVPFTRWWQNMEAVRHWTVYGTRKGLACWTI